MRGPVISLTAHQHTERLRDRPGHHPVQGAVCHLPGGGGGGGRTVCPTDTARSDGRDRTGAVSPPSSTW